MSLSRSVYLSQLRRAFLLRVHPDRFRNHPAEVRSRQAALVQALSNRLAEPDFVAWQSHRDSPSPSSDRRRNQPERSPSSSHLPYLVERRDGSFLSAALAVSDPVDSILRSMAQALEQSGAAALPAPPPSSTSAPSPASAPPNNNSQTSPSSSSYGEHPFTNDAWHSDGLPGSSSASSSSDATIDHRYDIQSRRGRDLRSFLLLSREPTQWHRDIEVRRLARTDAQAAAAQVRRLYGFQAVDAVASLGWSSRSVAVLLMRLVALHEEHRDKLPVTSYHSLRLVLTPSVPPSPHAAAVDAAPPNSDPPDRYRDDSYHRHHRDDHPALDVYGGALRLHPAATPLQWLESLQLVTSEHLVALGEYRAALEERTRALRSCLGGIQLVKGHTCSSRDYHAFVERLHSELVVGADGSQDTIVAPALEPVRVAVEAPRSVRGGGTVTSEGAVRVHAGLDVGDAARAVARHADAARLKARAHAADREDCRNFIQRMQWHLGVQRVSRWNATVTVPQFRMALARLLELAGCPDDVDSEGEAATSTVAYAKSQSPHDGPIPLELLQGALAGNSLAIASSGHFCHLGDDGSVVIPHDWR